MSTFIHFAIFTLGTGLFLLFWYGLYNIGNSYIGDYLAVDIGSFVLALILSWIVEGLIVTSLPKKFQ